MSGLQLLADFRRTIRILIVADGDIHFGPRLNGFTLMELIKNGLTGGSNPWAKLEITTARRLDDDDCEPCCTPNQNFRFDGELFKNTKFDELWLFGQLAEDDTPLEDSEIAEVLRFMNAGGGVFATGDHQSLGAAMCGKLPRVGSMRKWYDKQALTQELRAPGRDDTTRLDTLREGFNLGFQLDDQSDRVPQEIRPKFFLNPSRDGATPHPLLAARSGFAITVLPDHMHEGECMVPTVLTRTFELDGKSVPEYPEVPNTKLRISPQVVAISTSAGGYLLSINLKPVCPVEPRSFVSITAYWGDQVGIGRVAVDSSFHHFLDINLRGTGYPNSTGFFDCHGNPTKDYKAFKQYFKNIVGWLCPATARAELYRALLLDLRFNTALIEEITPVAHPTLRDYLRAGVVTSKAISERFSEAEVAQCCLALIGELSIEHKLTFEALINPWLPTELRLEPLDLVLHPDLVMNLLLGTTMLNIANDEELNREAHLTRPEAESKLPDVLSRVVAKSIEQVPLMLANLVKQSAQTLDEIL